MKDRPRKEKGWRRKVGDLEFLVLDIVDDVLGEYSTEQYEKDFKELENYIERAKTEAKIEVLQEVLDESEKLAVAEVEHLKKLAQITGSSWHYSSLGILGRTLEEKLDNLKKKKK